MSYQKAPHILSKLSDDSSGITKEQLKNINIMPNKIKELLIKYPNEHAKIFINYGK